jgi:hypothetical protein
MSVEDAPPVPTLARRKSRCLIALLAWFVVLEFLRGMLSVNWEMLFIGIDMVVLFGFLIQWTRLDADEHDFKMCGTLSRCW